MEMQNILYLVAFLCIKTVIVSCQCDQRPFGGSMMCCAGRNGQCFVKIRNATKNYTRKVCYCDEYCKLTKDCCPDFDKIKESCRGLFQIFDF